VTVRCAVVGSGNIGADLIAKLLRAEGLEPALLVGIDPDSDGLRRARELGVPTTADGVPALLEQAVDIDVVFEATSAAAHRAHAPQYAAAGLLALDLTPAALGPYVVPSVNLETALSEGNLNLVTCGGQATVPIVAALSGVADVGYAEIVSTISSRAAGPGTRANIDEFTQTTAAALRDVGGASSGKAIIVLNPADPPLIMRNTVFASVDPRADHDELRRAVNEMVARVNGYVPGYELVAPLQIDPGGGPGGTTKVTALLRVQGAGDYLPAYAGNLDIMTAAAVATAAQLAARGAIGVGAR
jgi:acetaldehyde dehydrogenase